MGGGVIQWAIQRPVSVAVGAILVVMFGMLSIIGIPIQLTPDITVPSISIRTLWPGATPTEIEADILIEQEEALKSLPGLVRMTSDARRDVGTIDLELEVGTSMQEALVRVSNLLSQVPNYPRNARQPIVSTANATGPPFAVLVIQSDPPGRDVSEYRTWVDEVIIPRFERIRGVANIRLIGGRNQEIHIDFDPSQLAARGVTVSHIAAAVRAELIDVSAGDISLGKRRYVVRTQLKPRIIEELENAVLRTDEGGTPILLGQVATVTPGLRKPDAFSFNNGQPALIMLFFREAGTNVLAVTEEVRGAVAELQAEHMAAEGLDLHIASDQTDYIKGALQRVRSNLVIGAILATLVLLLFLRSFGASTVVAIAIPISVVGTVLCMSLMGRTVNIVSLAGMAFAVGMVVDNSIVVLENIDAWRRREPSIARAALMGTREVWGAIVASTMTTAAVFIPIITWQDQVGELLRDVAVAISTAVIASLLVSVIVIPSFAARILAPRAGKASGPAGAQQEEFPRVGRVVHWIARSPLRSLAVATVGVVGATTLGLGLMPPLEYLPTGNRNVVFGMVIPPPGYSVAEMRRVGEHVQGRIVPHIGVERDGVPAFERSWFAGGPDQAFVGGVAKDPMQVRGVAEHMRKVLREVPDIIGVANQGSLFGGNLAGSRAVEIDILGSDLGGMINFGGQLMGALRAALPGAQVRPLPSLDLGAPEFRVEPRRAQAAQLGMSGADIGLIADVYVDGAIIGELGAAGESRRDVVLRAAGAAIDSPAALSAAPTATPRGRTVPFSEVATVTETMGPTVIRRIERRRAITLQVSPPETIALEDAIGRIKAEVAALEAKGAVPAGTRLAYAGSAGKLADAKIRFAYVLLLAVIITFLLLAALFEDFLAPVVILVTVPLAGAGGLLGLWLINKTLSTQPLDLLTATGFIILIGVVVNNAILIVDGALARMRNQDATLDDAVSAAVRRRVRPIFMTAMTSLAGLLPLVLFPGFGSELYRGVGGIVLGGLALSTLLSLFVVPALFSVVWRVRGLAGRLVRRGA